MVIINHFLVQWWVAYAQTQGILNDVSLHQVMRGLATKQVVLRILAT
jgi:hypothetical protein